jgi:hypothetical protein
VAKRKIARAKKVSSRGAMKKSTAGSKQPAAKGSKAKGKNGTAKKPARGRAAAEPRGRNASRVLVVTAASERGTPGAIRPRSGPPAEPIDELPLADIDNMRLINNLDMAAGSDHPEPSREHGPPPDVASLMASLEQKDRQLEEISGRLKRAAEIEKYQLALWWAGGVRLPRPAIVGRALHELESLTEEDAKARGTAELICVRIKQQNAAHLRNVIIKAMDSGLDSDEISAKLVGHLNRAWAVLEELGLLKAAYREGVYLVGDGQAVFDGFPDWSRPDEKPPTKPSRPKTKPPRS